LNQFWLQQCKLKILSREINSASLITFLPDINVSTADKSDLRHQEISIFVNILQTDNSSKPAMSHVIWEPKSIRKQIFGGIFRR
jgi:hypothetical protein